MKIALFLLAAVLIGFSGVLTAQDDLDGATSAENGNPKKTVKIDEFGRATDCDVSARVDNFFIQLNNQPDAIGYVITYLGEDMLPFQHDSTVMATRIRRNITFRKYDESRLVFMNGGFRKELTTEFFLVPPGGDAPQPTDTVPRPKDPTGTFLWSDNALITGEEAIGTLDEFILPSVKAKQEEEERLAELEAAAEEAEREAGEEQPIAESETASPTEAAGELEDEPAEEESLTAEEREELRFAWTDERFGTQVANRKDARGVIIFYADDEYYDAAKLKRFVEEGRDRIARAANLRPAQIKVVFGGFREWATAEYWIVPKGAKGPVPTPEERPANEESDEQEALAPPAQ